MSSNNSKDWLHTPVMLRECLEALNIRENGIYIDVTGGCGGHSAAILECLGPEGRLLVLDADKSAIEIIRQRFSEDTRVKVLRGHFSDISGWAKMAGITKCDGILADLGTSAIQLETADRGFSFMREGPLDMRMSVAGDLSADTIVNDWPEENLRSVIREFGEDRNAFRIARAIVRNRPVKDTLHLAGIIEKVSGGRRKRIHPATKTFQAIRIAVNGEMEQLEKLLDSSGKLLRPGGRLVILSYHSLEDRIVKRYMKINSATCICPPGLPECRCYHVPLFDLHRKKSITPEEAEVTANPRARSARLRMAERREV